jgi:hypothetical protein
VHEPLGLAHGEVLQAVVSFHRYGQVALRTPALVALAEAVATLNTLLNLGTRHDISGMQEAQSNISGDVTMTSLALLQQALPGVELTVSLLQGYFRAEMQRFYVVLMWSAYTCSYYRGHLGFLGTQILVAKHMEGQQLIHTDSLKDKMGHAEVTCLLYAGDCMSVRTPRYSLFWAARLHRHKRSARAASMLQQDEFSHSVSVSAGTVVLFRHMLFHGGSRNLDAEKHRVVMFDAMVDTRNGNRPDSDQQRFRWQWFEWAFGYGRPETLAAIQRDVDTKLQPLRHVMDEEAEQRRQCLSKQTHQVYSTIAAQDRAVKSMLQLARQNRL